MNTFLRTGAILILAIIPLVPVVADSSAGDFHWGTHLLAGARYDDVRMCVGSPPGVPGGPIMDVYLDLRFATGNESFLVVNIPVLRPILFGIAFDMLQFEPQVTFERFFGSGDNSRFVLGLGLGAIFHYGPDYNSDPGNPGPSFFAAGPLFSISTGWAIRAGGGTWMPGLKLFYAPLFSPDYRNGTVAGGGLELHYLFAFPDSRR